MRYLYKDSCAVAGLRVRTCSAPVHQVLERKDAFPDDIIRLAAFDIADETYAAAVALELRIIEPLFLRKVAERRLFLSHLFNQLIKKDAFYY